MPVVPELAVDVVEELVSEVALEPSVLLELGCVEAVELELGAALVSVLCALVLP